MARKVIIIGLGGQGGYFANEIKKVFEVKGTLTDEDFIAIDSNYEDLCNLDRIDNERKFWLKDPPNVLLRHKFPWIYPDLIENRKIGERKRIFGRVLYLFNKTILNAFLHSIFESKDRSRSYIFIIINSLGGGTGSSMFHEIALLLRKSEFLRYSSKMIIGIGILPTPDEEIGILANAYASLKEINFLQNLDQAEEKKMNYEKPFDAYFLLDQEIKGEIIRDDLLTVITEYLNVLCFGSRSFVYGLSLDAGDLMTRYFPYRGCFSTLGVYKVLFPRNVSQ